MTQNEKMSVYVKKGGKWILELEQTIKSEIYRTLTSCYYWKYTAKGAGYGRITDKCNYDGTRTITSYSDDGIVKRVFIVKM